MRPKRKLKTKSKKFQIRLEPGEHRAMMIMSDRQQITMSAFVANYIRHEAKRQGIKL